MEVTRPLLEADQLYRFFHAGEEETLALRGVSLSVDGGEIVAVTGPSGSGKSTLLGCLAGLDEPDGGIVHVAGRQLSRRPEPERAALRAAHLGILFQSGNLIEHLTVDQNVAMAQRLAGKPDATRRAHVLGQLGIGRRSDAYPAELSGGEMARAGLAVALANGPDVLLADEPTGEVDGVAETGVLALLAEVAAGGAAVVVVTHSDAVAAAADRRITLHDGEVVE